MLFSEEEAKNEGSVKDKFANHFFPRSGQRASASDMSHRGRAAKSSPFSPLPHFDSFLPFHRFIKSFRVREVF